MAERVFSHDEAFAAMCIMEEIVTPNLAGTPWQDYREQWGINQLRDDILTKLAHACRQKWSEVSSKYYADYLEWSRRYDAARLRDEHTGAWLTNPVWSAANPEPQDPGSFDYEFVPMWLRLFVDWSDINGGPRVKGTTIPEKIDG